MNLAEQPPSTQWASLKFRGEKFAEVWFKPEGQPWGLTFRIPRESFRPGLAQVLTPENLLKTVAISPKEVESWSYGDASLANSDMGQPFPPPAPDVPHLTVTVSLKQPPPEVAREEGPESEAARVERMNDLEARWNAIQGLEAALDQLRQRVEGAEAEMVTGAARTLTTEEKLGSISADVLPWNKAKSRSHFATPKAKEFLHRATWAMDTPERKKAGEYFKSETRPYLSLSDMNKLLAQLDKLLKDRQVLSAQGGKVYQECKTITAEIQSTLKTLIANAARNLKRKKAAKKGGKFFKDVRKISGLD